MPHEQGQPCYMHLSSVSFIFINDRLRPKKASNLASLIIGNFQSSTSSDSCTTYRRPRSTAMRGCFRTEIMWEQAVYHNDRPPSRTREPSKDLHVEVSSDTKSNTGSRSKIPGNASKATFHPTTFASSSCTMTILQEASSVSPKAWTDAPTTDLWYRSHIALSNKRTSGTSRSWMANVTQKYRTNVDPSKDLIVIYVMGIGSVAAGRGDGVGPEALCRGWRCRMVESVVPAAESTALQRCA